jgi:hypothetical protein
MVPELGLGRLFDNPAIAGWRGRNFPTNQGQVNGIALSADPAIPAEKTPDCT